MKKRAKLFAMALTAMALLSACGNSSTSSSSASSGDSEVKLEKTVDNEGTPIKGGTLKVAEVSDSPFKGLWYTTWSTEATDSDIGNWANESLFQTDPDYKINDKGAAGVKLDRKNKTATVTLKDNLNWSDGKPVTADDLIFSYEVIADKDYTGVRYDSDMMNVVGIGDYHDGKASSISGLEKVSDKVLKIHFKEMTPSMLYGFGGLPSEALPKHALESIPVKDMEKSDVVRKNPITYGAFKFKKVVPGESVEFEANKDYYKGAPKVDKVIVKIVPSSSILSALKNGEYDIVQQMPTSTYKTYKDYKNYDILGETSLYYGYIGFKLGKWDNQKGEVAYNKNAKMANKALRQAIGYAVDNDQVSNKLYNGLQQRANSLIVPNFNDLHMDKKDLPGFTYDPEKAKKLLDDAGYKDTDGDGLREDPDGKKLTINFAMPSGSSTTEALSEYYLQSFKAIGLDVRLLNGRLMDSNDFFDRVQKDDKDIDMYSSGWGVASDPNPTGLHGKFEQFNLTRYTDDKLNTILKNLSSEKAFDEKYQKEQYDAFQKYMNDIAVEIPQRYALDVTPVNKRVKHYSVDRMGHVTEYQEIELTADNPVK